MNSGEMCSREPIHIPGAIQPHGVLLAFSLPDLVCRQASANASEFFPGNVLPGKKAPEILPAEMVEACLQEDPAPPVSLRLRGRMFDASIHRHQDRLIVEIEPSGEDSLSRHHRKLQRSFAELRSAAGLPELYTAAARFIADFTGFERVMVYRFDTDWHGEVVGECLRAEVASYLGHHFPASDIPEQARALYRKNWLRLIPDAEYQPVPIEPPSDVPLDLSFSILRSVSPVHLAYLRNMDVRASMSISLMAGDHLWGLIACHHRQPLYLSYARRAACEIFGQFASLEIASKIQALRLGEKARATSIQTRFFDFLAQEGNFVDALVKYTPHLLEFMSANGAAVFVNGRLTLLGETPPAPACTDLIDWLQTQNLDPLLATDHLGALHPPAAAWTALASGLLAVKLSRVEPHYVLWFRPETPTTITWAGHPEKPTETLHPRKSFAAWKEIITGRSRPWTEAERHGARELRTAINALVLRRTEGLINLNAELERKNSDLNSFAYIAAHDLKEPLRGIANYAEFLLEDHGGALPEEAVRKLRSIGSLAARSRQLLDALNHYSRLGRIEINRTPVEMDHLLDEVIESLGSTLENASLQRPRPLPRIACDPVLAREVFANLLSNAVRYNTSPEKIVEIVWRGDTSAPVFSLRDNGIGIRKKHLDAIFHIFRRLHAADEFGGGTGAGLAIVKSIIERHGGNIRVESAPGSGSTFFFTFA
jgi:chemotaxis family two-component system sensor kinase Cph1